MSTNDAPADKSRLRQDAKLSDLPGDWRPARSEEAAFLVHETGARLIVRRTAPPTQPTPGQHHDQCFELNFQPRDSQHLRVLVTDGPRDGLRDAALAFARDHPDAQPADDEFAFPSAWEGAE